MRPFLRRVAGFGMIVTVAAALSALLNAGLWRFHRPAWEPPPRIVAMGDSHMAMTLDPSRLPGSVNLGRNRELLVMTYYKLLEVLESGYRPDVVLLSVAPHNISAQWEHDALNRPETAFEVFAVYYGLVPWFETGLDLRWSSWLAYLAKNWLTPNVHLLGDGEAVLRGRSTERVHEYLGGFDPFTGGELLAERLELGLVQHYGDGDPTVSDIEVEYLERIVATTREAGIRTVLFMSPEHPDYLARVPASMDGAFRSLIERLRGDPGVHVIDLTRMEIPEDEWANHDHVNLLGSARVTDSLAALVDAPAP